MLKRIGIVACGVAVAIAGSLATRAAESKAPEIKGGIEGEVVKVDVEKGLLTIAREDGRERTFSITDETTIVGPRGGVVHRRLRDRRFHKGLPITVVANGEAATELHLGFDRKTRAGSPSTADGSTPDQGTQPPTRRTSRFRGLLGKTPSETAKPADAEDEDNEFPGMIKTVDANKRMLVITLLNGKERSFILARDVKVTLHGRAVRLGLGDSKVKPGIPVTVITEEGGRKVKEVNITPPRKAKKAS